MPKVIWSSSTGLRILGIRIGRRRHADQVAEGWQGAKARRFACVLILSALAREGHPIHSRSPEAFHGKRHVDDGTWRARPESSEPGRPAALATGFDAGSRFRCRRSSAGRPSPLPRSARKIFCHVSTDRCGASGRCAHAGLQDSSILARPRPGGLPGRSVDPNVSGSVFLVAMRLASPAIAPTAFIVS